MLTINYEAWVVGPTAKHRIYIRAQGTTPDEVKADAERQRLAINAIDMIGIGLQNTEANWIAVYGNNYSPDCTFSDSFSQRK